MFEYVIRVSLHYAAQHHQHCAKMLKRKANYINSLLLENYSKFLKARAKDFIFNFFTFVHHFLRFPNGNYYLKNPISLKKVCDPETWIHCYRFFKAIEMSGAEGF